MNLTFLKLRYIIRLLFYSIGALAVAFRARFAACDSCHPGSDACRRAFVFISTHPFAGLWQRPQQIAVRIANRHPVLYVWPRYASELARRKSKSEFTPSDGAKGVHLLAPLLLPFERAIKGIYRINLKTISSLISAALPRIDADGRPVLWFYAPRFAPIIDSLDHAAVVYDIMDEHSAFGFARRETMELERRLLESADVVFAGTNALAERKAEFAPDIKYYPCGVEFDHFSSALGGSLPVPAALSEVEGPVIGYFGAVDDRLDFDMIFAVARAYPEWNFLLAGPWLSSRQRSELETTGNIILPGLVDYSELPAYLARFDVAILPFVLNKLTLHIHPTKALEYLASRTPVISTAIPDVVKFYSGIIDIVSTADEFASAVERALEKPNEDAIERGFELARSSSWENMVENMWADFEAALSKNRPDSK
ncbi:MAG: glycosyltransferase [Candidatus Coatesbacteria bacterium]|nr:glycosyltransferase [Candidatus Coatesbacteria bacterium]